STKQFLQVYSVCSTVFSQVDIITDGKAPTFDASHSLDLTHKDYKKVNTIKNDYQGLVIPDALGTFLQSFCKFKSIKLKYFKSDIEPVCMIGRGAAALLSTKPDIDQEWIFARYSLTGPSNIDDFNDGVYGKYPSIEDFCFENLGNYTCSRKNALHIIVDDNVVTGQNKTSTLIAIQTFILLCNR
ncbi:hypothetical protein BC833DRAFT_526411, partial [Globomyces pollinis-pini]